MPEFTKAAKDLLKKKEACRLRAYQDEKGVWTIGWGHTGRDFTATSVWTQQQADLTFETDLGAFVSGVRALLRNATTSLTDNQFSALVILAYNIGLDAFGGSTVMKLIRAGNLDPVPNAIAMWNKIKDQRTGEYKVSSGLITRRNSEIQLWRTP